MRGKRVTKESFPYIYIIYIYIYSKVCMCEISILISLMSIVLYENVKKKKKKKDDECLSLSNIYYIFSFLLYNIDIYFKYIHLVIYDNLIFTHNLFLVILIYIY